MSMRPSHRERQAVIGIFFAIIFGIIFFRLTPLIRRQSVKVADNIEDDLRGVSANDLFIGVIGLITGLLIALLITQIYVSITNKYVYTVITIITYMILGYLGVVIATKKGKEMLALIVSNRGQAAKDPIFTKGKKKHEGIPKIFDTSVIIDGRIAEIMKTGFLEGTDYHSGVCAGRASPYCGFFRLAETDQGQKGAWTF